MIRRDVTVHLTSPPACFGDPACPHMAPVEYIEPHAEYVPVPGRGPRVRWVPGAWRYWCPVHRQGTYVQDPPAGQEGASAG